MKVLIADDSPLVRERLRAVMAELSGVEIVGEAQDGLETIEKVRELRPDVVTLDIHMPKANGITVLQSIEHVEGRPVVIVLTSYPGLAYREKCIQAGAHAVLEKSSQFGRLSEMLQGLAQQWEADASMA